MSTKFISLATGIVFLDVYLQSQLSSNDPLFLFASNSLALNAGLFCLVALMIAVSFMGKFKHWQSYIACSIAAILLGTLGVIGVFFSDMFYSFPQILEPLDYLFLMEAAVVFGISALSYEHQEVPMKSRLQIHFPVSSRFVFPALKALQSPKHTSSGGAQPA